MTDSELDEILNQWSAPCPPPFTRKHVQARFSTLPPRKRCWRKSAVAAGVLASAALFLLVTQAFPQRPARPPWSVDSEFVRYADDGSTSIEMDSTSYESNGAEILLSRSTPGNPFKTALMTGVDVALPAASRLQMRLLGVLQPGMLERMERMKRSRPPGLSFLTGCEPGSGCLILDHFGYLKSAAGTGGSCVDKPVVDRTTILHHPTEAIQDRWTEQGRMTLWMAPDLDCFALRVTYEEQLPDGTFHLVSAKQALRVNSNP